MIIPGSLRTTETDKGAANDVSAKYKVVSGRNIVLPPYVDSLKLLH